MFSQDVVLLNPFYICPSRVPEPSLRLACEHAYREGLGEPQNTAMTKQKYDDSAFTRRWCVFGLVMSWFVGIGALLAGAISMYLEVRDGSAPHLVLSHTWREVLPLGLNICGKSPFPLPTWTF